MTPEREQQWQRAFGLIKAIQLVLRTGVDNWGEGKPAAGVLHYLTEAYNSFAREVSLPQKEGPW